MSSIFVIKLTPSIFFLSIITWFHRKSSCWGLNIFKEHYILLYNYRYIITARCICSIKLDIGYLHFLGLQIYEIYVFQFVADICK